MPEPDAMGWHSMAVTVIELLVIYMKPSYSTIVIIAGALLKLGRNVLRILK
jgi:hypothetical protein